MCGFVPQTVLWHQYTTNRITVSSCPRGQVAIRTLHSGLRSNLCNRCWIYHSHNYSRNRIRRCSNRRRIQTAPSNNSTLTQQCRASCLRHGNRTIPCRGDITNGSSRICKGICSARGSNNAANEGISTKTAVSQYCLEEKPGGPHILHCRSLTVVFLYGAPRPVRSGAHRHTHASGSGSDRRRILLHRVSRPCCCYTGQSSTDAGQQRSTALSWL